MGPVRQNRIQRTFRSVHVCALHCAQLLHTILHRTDLIIFPPTLQTFTIAPMMSIWGKGVLQISYLYHQLCKFHAGSSISKNLGRWRGEGCARCQRSMVATPMDTVHIHNFILQHFTESSRITKYKLTNGETVDICTNRMVDTSRDTGFMYSGDTT